MELDEDVKENLKMQFKALQALQQKRVQNLMEKKRDKQQSLKNSNEENQNETFGVQDDLNLSTLDSQMLKEDIGMKLVNDESEQLQQQLRETVDENGRLYKLLKERDFEIKQLHKNIEEERLAFMGKSGLAGDVAATKIVELAKQNRHLTAEIEREKAKVKRLNNQLRELEKGLQMSSICGHQVQSPSDRNSRPTHKVAEAPLSPEMKALQEKLTAANFKVSEYRNQLQSTKQELKMTQKLLTNEVGEDVSIQNLLSTPGSWRGRAQQILVLQGKVRELENQLGYRQSGMSESGANEGALRCTNSRKESAQEKNLRRIKNLEKEKKEALEKLTNEHNTLQKDHEEVKKKLDASRARNKVLSGEVKSLKEQISTLLDKGKHDDELIDALLSQQKEMQAILKNLSQQDERNKECQRDLGQQLHVEMQKQNCLIEQLKQMVAEREARVKELEEKVRQLTSSPRHLNQTEESGSDSISTLSTESLEEESCSAPSRRGDGFWKSSSAQMVSKMGHTLVDSAATTSSSGRTAEPDAPTDFKTLKIEITEYKALCQAVQVERDRLIGLVSLLQKRVDESMSKVWEAEKKLEDHQNKYIALELQFEKLKAGKNTRSPPKAHSKGRAVLSFSSSAGDRKDHSLAQLSEVPLESQVEELSTRLAIQVDENRGLKSALQTAMKAKEEDFRVYQETVDQVKDIFLHALRQQKQDKN